jgi:cation:H+ antiporter
MIWLTVVILVVSLFLLVKSSDFFVESVAKIAKLFGVSSFVIGMSVVAIGTSLPELVTSVIAVTSGSADLVVGAVIGSNIANIVFFSKCCNCCFYFCRYSNNKCA